MSLPSQISQKWHDISDITKIKICGQKDVYRAVSQSYGPIAIKVYRNLDSRAEREIQLMQGFDKPQIPRIFDYHCFADEHELQMVILEEFIEGNSLRDYLAEGKRYDIEQTIRLLHFLLDIVVFLENNAIVHRDIKPDNILCSTDGSFRLIDFGIARDLSQASITATGDFGPCTPGYAPPEQFKNVKAQITSRADLFAIGVVAYEMVSGKNPYVEKDDSLFDILSRTGTMPTPILPLIDEYNRELFSFIRALMAKQVYKRPSTAAKAYEWFLRICQERELSIEKDQKTLEEEKKMGDFLE